jgi:hypothetical protein
MNKFKAIGVILFLLPRADASAQDGAIEDPIRYFASRYTDTTRDGKTIDNTMVRLVLDFNNDGLVDIALSDSYLWGNAGGYWEFFLQNDNRKYHCIGYVMLHPSAFRIEPVRAGVSRLTVYIHNDAGSGDLNTYEICSDSITFISTLLLHTGDDHPAGEKEYQRLFGYLRAKPLCEYITVYGYLRDPTLPWHPGY